MKIFCVELWDWGVNVWDEKGWIVLYFVFWMILVDFVYLLLDVGVDIYVYDKDGYILLYMVVSYSWCDCVKFFLEYGKFIKFWLIWFVLGFVMYWEFINFGYEFYVI